MTFNKLSENLSVVAMFLIGFQYFAIPFYNSRYDLTCFLLLLSTVLATKNSKLMSQTLIIVFATFVSIELFKYLYFQTAPLHRLFSGLVWFGGLILIFLKKDFIYYNQKKIFNAILSGLFVICAFMFFQYITGSQWPVVLSTSVHRPTGLFDEPSYAGLFLYSISSAFFGVVLLARIKLNHKLFYTMLGVLTFILGLITMSLHIVTFFIVFPVILLIYFSVGSSKTFKVLITIIFVTISILILMFIILKTSHYLDRFNFFTINQQTEISVLAWLRGFDQAFHVFKSSPIFGFGLGSTGHFEMNSFSQQVLESIDMGMLTKMDAYSMFFRLVVELGFVFILMTLIYMLVQLKNLRSLLLNKNYLIYNFKYAIFIFIFSFSLMIGILIKEPTYSRSYVFASIFLFSTIVTIVKKDIANKIKFS